MKFIPLYKGRKILHDHEYVVGNLIKDVEQNITYFYIQVNENIEYISDGFVGGFASSDFEEIDATTLAISFDGGKHWYNDIDLIDTVLKTHKIDTI